MNHTIVIIKKRNIYILFLVLCLSCNNKRIGNDIHSPRIENSTIKELVKQDSFTNYFRIDSTLKKTIAFDYLFVKNKNGFDSIVSLCNCKKNKKNNSIAIQIQTAIPTKKELDSLDINDYKRRNRFLQLKVSQNKFKGQLKFLTIKLRDSTVEGIKLYSKSTDKDYNEENFNLTSIDKYHISISKFDYSIASDVFGNYEFRLSKEFGLNGNDTIIKGRFLCNNWKIMQEKDIKNLLSQ